MPVEKLRKVWMMPHTWKIILWVHAIRWTWYQTPGYAHSTSSHEILSAWCKTCMMPRSQGTGEPLSSCHVRSCMRCCDVIPCTQVYEAISSCDDTLIRARAEDASRAGMSLLRHKCYGLLQKQLTCRHMCTDTHAYRHTHTHLRHRLQ